jgi:hypothetical protein
MRRREFITLLGGYGGGVAARGASADAAQTTDRRVAYPTGKSSLKRLLAERSWPSQQNGWIDSLEAIGSVFVLLRTFLSPLRFSG